MFASLTHFRHKSVSLREASLEASFVGVSRFGRDVYDYCVIKLCSSPETLREGVLHITRGKLVGAPRLRNHLGSNDGSTLIMSGLSSFLVVTIQSNTEFGVAISQGD
jgi:hypothetical protein